MKSITEQLTSRIVNEVIMEQEYPIGFENDYPKEYRNKRRTLLGRGPHGAPYGKGGWEFDAYVKGIPLEKHPEYKRSVNFDRVRDAAKASKHGMGHRNFDVPRANMTPSQRSDVLTALRGPQPSNITPRQALGALGRGAGVAGSGAGAGLSGYDIGSALVGDGGEGFLDRPAQTDLAADASSRGAGYEFGPASPYNTDSVTDRAAQYGQNLATGTVDNFRDAISSSGWANLIPAVPLAKMAMSQSQLPFDALRGSEVEYDDTVETDSPDGPITQAGREALVAHRTGDHVGSLSDIENRIAHARRRRAIAPEFEKRAMGY